MTKERKEEFISWKNELESRRQEILKRKAIIVKKLTKYQWRLEIASSIEEEMKSTIYEELEKKVHLLKQELEAFNTANDPQLREIEVIVSKLQRQLI